MRSNYWSNSKFAQLVQSTVANVEKPIALPLGQWKVWDNAFKTGHPFVYWFTEEFLDTLQKIVCWPNDKLRDFRYWGYNRFVTKPHYLNTKLGKGTYHEIDQRIIHGLFETLVDFIEVEKAWMLVVWNDEERAKYYLPWYKRVPYFLRWKEWRCPEAGLAHLKWEMSLTNECEWASADEKSTDASCGLPTSQAVAAKEQYELYNWWKNTRPLRPDPMDASGWSDYCKAMDAKYGDLGWMEERNEQEQTASKLALDKTNEIEEMYDHEDEEMLIRLIRIRRSLWT